jgi:NAD-dependent deacetylase
VTVLTGAGVSAASGVPTFRGPDGLWRSFRAEDLATPEAFARDPRLVWEWYDWRRQRIAACEPNPAHHVLADWSLRFRRFTLITQNVDGLHERAGTARALRLHGSIWEVGCWRRCRAAPHRWRDDTTPFPELPPACPHCGGPLRPGVVWFGEALHPGTVEASVEATACDVFFTIGTSALVYPAAGLINHAQRHGAMTVEINPDSTPASAGVSVAVASPAEAALPALDSRLGPHPLSIETDRQQLVPALPRDARVLHAIWTDEAVRRYLWDDTIIPLATAVGVAQASAADFAAHRFGIWTIRERPNPTEVIGFCGLRTGALGPEPELVFGLRPDRWGRGLAHEAARAVLDHAFRSLRVPRVIAATDAPNERSARTLAALGMRLDRRAPYEGRETLFFSLDAAVGGR